jgi:hypothetical protein
MAALLRAFQAEILKVRRTLAFWSAVVVPVAIVLLYFIIYSRPAGANLLRGRDAWLWMTQNVLILWSLIMLPLFVALETALLAGLEHRASGWKHLFALPVPRWSIYAAKALMGTGLIGLAMVSLLGWIFLVGKGINLLNPGIGFEKPFPLISVGGLVAAVYLASWFIIAIHTWIAVRWHSFVVPIGVGIVTVFVTLVVTQTRLWWLFPWALPGNVENILFVWMAGGPMLHPISLAWFSIGLSLTGYVVVGLLGYRNVVRQDVL